MYSVTCRIVNFDVDRFCVRKIYVDDCMAVKRIGVQNHFDAIALCATRWIAFDIGRMDLCCYFDLASDTAEPHFAYLFILYRCFFLL